MSCDLCGMLSGHRDIQIPDDGKVFPSRASYACPNSLPSTKPDFATLERRCAEQAHTIKVLKALTDMKEVHRTARLSEANGAFKRTQQVVKFLRYRAGDYGSSVARFALYEAANAIATGEELE